MFSTNLDQNLIVLFQSSTMLLFSILVGTYSPAPMNSWFGGSDGSYVHSFEEVKALLGRAGCSKVAPYTLRRYVLLDLCQPLFTGLVCPCTSEVVPLCVRLPVTW